MSRLRTSTREIEKAQQGIRSGQSRRAVSTARLPQLQKQLEAEEEKVKDEDLSLVHESRYRGGDRQDRIPLDRDPGGQADGERAEQDRCIWTDELHKRVIGQDEGCDER